MPISVVRTLYRFGAADPGGAASNAVPFRGMNVAMTVHFCTRCELRFPSAAETTQHLRDAHGVDHSTAVGEYRRHSDPGIEPPAQIYICDDCSLSFLDAFELSHHRSGEHAET